VITSPHELVTEGGVGTACASSMHPTVALPFAGSVNVGGSIVYVNTQSKVLPEQSRYDQVYVFVPLQTGSGPTTGPVGVTGSPQESSTVGGVGTTCASAIQGTVAEPGAGNVNVGGVIVYVNTQSSALPEQSMYVQV
jgi:hypothetical protein